MKKAIVFAAIAALAGVVTAADTKVGTIKFGNDLKLVEACVTHQSLAGCATAAQGAKADSALQQTDVTLAAADNGGISVTIGTASQATSLGTAASTAATAYATAAQGGKADTAVQPAALGDYTKTADLGDLAMMDTITLAKVTDAGTAAASDATAFATAAQGGKADTAVQPAALNDYTKTADLGDLAMLDTITLAKVTDAGTAAAANTNAFATAAQGTKADSALQQSDVAISTGSNGGISVKVGSAQAANSLGALATKNSVDASVIDVELGDYYLVDGTNEGDIDVMKRVAAE